MVAQVCDPSIQEPETGGLPQFQNSLGYLVTPCDKNKQKNNKTIPEL